MKPFLLQQEGYLENQEQQRLQKEKPDDGAGRQNNVELTLGSGMSCKSLHLNSL